MSGLDSMKKLEAEIEAWSNRQWNIDNARTWAWADRLAALRERLLEASPTGDVDNGGMLRDIAGLDPGGDEGGDAMYCSCPKGTGAGLNPGCPLHGRQ